MLVTNTHLNWWRSKHEPTWASRITSKVKPSAPSIHDLINMQFSYPYNPKAKKEDLELHNTLSLLRLRRATLTDACNLDQLLMSPHSSGPRKVWCARMLRKMRAARRRAV